MHCTDGYLAAGPTRNRDVYRKVLEDAIERFKSYGALRLVEC